MLMLKYYMVEKIRYIIRFKNKDEEIKAIRALREIRLDFRALNKKDYDLSKIQVDYLKSQDIKFKEIVN